MDTNTLGVDPKKRKTSSVENDNNLHDQALVPTGLRTIVFPAKATNETFLNTLVSRCKYLRYLKLRNSENWELES